MTQKMDATTRIKMTLGDLLLQLASAHAQIDDLQEQVEQLKGPAAEARTMRGPCSTFSSVRFGDKSALAGTVESR
jgi:hypothetical protein